jgi:hypothetical protein
MNGVPIYTIMVRQTATPGDVDALDDCAGPLSFIVHRGNPMRFRSASHFYKFANRRFCSAISQSSR